MLDLRATGRLLTNKTTVYVRVAVALDEYMSTVPACRNGLFHACPAGRNIDFLANVDDSHKGICYLKI